MNILFMSLGTFYNLDEGSVHIDLLKSLAEEHDVWLVCKNEGQSTEMTYELGIHVLRVHTGEQKRVGLIKKGLNTVLVGPQFKSAISRHLRDVKFDLVLYTTPPITFVNAVRYIKRRDSAATYLMLKDIFPQNAVDIGILAKHGFRGLLWRYFRLEEKRLYGCSDYIGCMSQANVDYVIAENPELDSTNVGICPNSVTPKDMSCDEAKRKELRGKYGIPQDKTVFIYGGNLGRPQDIPFLIECLRSQGENERAFFLIVGTGTEYEKLESFFMNEHPTNAKLMQRLPKEDYDALVGSCDVGLILLDHRFTIPNFPSRILSYMQAKIPVLCATDANTDVGHVAEAGGFGISCSSANVESFNGGVEKMLAADCKAMGCAGWEYLRANYDARKVAHQILDTVSTVRARLA